MRNIFPTSSWNATHIAQLKTLPSNLDSAHCILIGKLCCLCTNILGKTEGSLDLEPQPWPECARPPSSHRQPRNFACPCCQDVQRPTQVWAEVIAELWVNLGGSGKSATDCSLRRAFISVIPGCVSFLMSHVFLFLGVWQWHLHCGWLYLYKGIILFNFDRMWKEGETTFSTIIRGEKLVEKKEHPIL